MGSKPASRSSSGAMAADAATATADPSEPLGRMEVAAAALWRNTPHRIQNANKKAVLRHIAPEPTGPLSISRWRPNEPPATLRVPAAGQRVCRHEVRADVFDYRPVAAAAAGAAAGAAVMEWHVNFADFHLFVAYQGSLFAQDEMQALEHPVLGAVKDHLVAAAKQDPSSPMLPFTRADSAAGAPTPILVAGAQRFCCIQTNANAAEGRPNGLYGREFGRASEEAVLRATLRIDPPTRTNLICMAALGYRSGQYRVEEIRDALLTAYTSFAAARAEAEYLQRKASPIVDTFPAATTADSAATTAATTTTTAAAASLVTALPTPPPPVTVVIHTGNWGCGAFGGNRFLMTAVQMLAAELAGIHHLVFHAVDAGENAWRDGMQMLNNAADRNFDGIVEMLHEKAYKWGVSDGN